MLVQKQAPNRIRYLLIGGGVALALLAGYVVYVNFFSGAEPVGVTQAPAKKTVPTDFGQDLFSDSRFYGLVPKQGTALITQASASRPSELLLPPKSLQGFDMQTGSAVLLTWERPTDETRATLVRVNQIVGSEERKNLATLPVPSTTYVFREAPTGTRITYEVVYIQQSILQESPQVSAAAGSVGGLVSVTRADDNGVTLQYGKPNGEFENVEVYRSAEVGVLGARVARLGTDGSTFEDASGRAGLHFYTFRWVGATGSGTPATVSVLATDTTAPNPPDGVRAILDTTNSAQPRMRVTWEPSSSADVVEYRIFRSNQAMNLGALVASKLVKDLVQLQDAAQLTGTECAKTLCFEDTEVVAGATAYYTVVAVDNAGNRSTTQDLSVPGRANPFIAL